MTDRPPVRALLSVSDKTGIVEFAQGLIQRGVKLLSTGGNRKIIGTIWFTSDRSV